MVSRIVVRPEMVGGCAKDDINVTMVTGTPRSKCNMRIFGVYGKKRVAVNVAAGNTVGQVKRKLQIQLNIYIDELVKEDKKVLVISYAGSDLDDNWIFTDLGIISGSTVRVCLKEEEKPVLFVKCSHNDELIEIMDDYFVEKMLVDDLRTIVAKKAGLPVSIFRLISRKNVELLDQHVLFDYNIECGDTVYMEVWDGWGDFVNDCIRGKTKKVKKELVEDEVQSRFQLKVAMYIGSHFGCIELVNWCMKLDIRPDEPIGEHPARQWCREQSHIEVFRAPVHEAAEFGQLQVLTNFYDENKNNTWLMARDGHDLTPLNLALRNHKKACAQFLLTKQWSRVKFANKSMSLQLVRRITLWCDRCKERAYMKYGPSKSSLKRRTFTTGPLVTHGVIVDGYPASMANDHAKPVIRRYLKDRSKPDDGNTNVLDIYDPKAYFRHITNNKNGSSLNLRRVKGVDFSAKPESLSARENGTKIGNRAVPKMSEISEVTCDTSKEISEEADDVFADDGVVEESFKAKVRGSTSMSRQGSTRQIPAENALSRQGSTRQIPTGIPLSRQGSTRQIPIENPLSRQGSTRQIPIENPLSRQGSTRQIPKENPLSRQGSTRQIPTGNALSRQGSTRQIPIENTLSRQGSTRQISTENTLSRQGSTRQIPTENTLSRQGSTRQIPSENTLSRQGSTRQIPTENGLSRQGSTRQIPLDKTISRQNSMRQIVEETPETAKNLRQKIRPATAHVSGVEQSAVGRGKTTPMSGRSERRANRAVSAMPTVGRRRLKVVREDDEALPHSTAEYNLRPFYYYNGTRGAENLNCLIDTVEQYYDMDAKSRATKSLQIATTFREKSWLTRVQMAMALSPTSLKREVTSLEHSFGLSKYHKRRMSRSATFVGRTNVGVETDDVRRPQSDGNIKRNVIPNIDVTKCIETGESFDDTSNVKSLPIDDVNRKGKGAVKVQTETPADGIKGTAVTDKRP